LLKRINGEFSWWLRNSVAVLPIRRLLGLIALHFGNGQWPGLTLAQVVLKEVLDVRSVGHVIHATGLLPLLCATNLGHLPRDFAWPLGSTYLVDLLVREWRLSRVD
jgi:hypothetical protein